MNFASKAARVRDAITGRTPNGAGWYRVHCPFCVDVVGTPGRHRTLAANDKKGYFKCWRCATAGFYIEGLERLRMDEPTAKVRELAPVELPEFFQPLQAAFEGSAIAAMNLGDAVNYMFARGVTPDTCVSVGVGFCASGPCRGRVVIPVDVESVRVGWVARDIYGRSSIKYIYPRGMPRGSFLFNEAALFVDTDEPVIPMEGVFDAMPYYPHATAFMGKPSDQHYDLLCQSQRPIAVAMDGDATIEGWSLTMKLRLDGLRAGHVALPAGRDPNSVDRAALVHTARRCITEAL